MGRRRGEKERAPLPVTISKIRFNLSAAAGLPEAIVSETPRIPEISMSRIWQALRQAEQERARAVAPQGVPDIEETEREPVSDETSLATKDSERRKGLRHSHETTLLVYGSDAEKQPFHEQSESIDANENGCLLSLTSTVSRGQRLFLTNMRNQAEQECKVVYVGRRTRGKSRVGVEFTQAAPHFWRLR
jgi:hypothetical protein